MQDIALDILYEKHSDGRYYIKSLDVPGLHLAGTVHFPQLCADAGRHSRSHFDRRIDPYKVVPDSVQTDHMNMVREFFGVTSRSEFAADLFGVANAPERSRDARNLRNGPPT